ncbi:MAG TPA: 30S ribosomal protein S20 [Pirellulales bacterium]|jgi:small subunit ribosomal protein S20|nr:30S ribosomal protein S20 [Pirellulales bacterium]
MPNIAGAKKRLRQSLVRRARNRATKSELKTRIRKVLELATAGDIEKSETEFRLTTKKLDQAAAARVIHANRASRVKSRISARLKAAKGKK